MQGNFARGARYLLRGAQLLKHPQLRIFVLVPLAINILIFGSAIGISYSYLADMMDAMLSRSFEREESITGSGRSTINDTAVDNRRKVHLS